MWISNILITSRFSVSKLLAARLAERRQILREQCQHKPPNLNFVEEADFSRFIVIEKLKLVFCYIPKISSTTWKQVLYQAENNGTSLKGDSHRRDIFTWLQDYSTAERKKIIDTYFKAIFVREPFARLLSAYKHKMKGLGHEWFKKIDPSIPEEEIEKETFPLFVRRYILDFNHTQTNQHWRRYEQICPCEVNYDFIGHFENLAEEAPQLLKMTGVDDYVTFPEYQPSKSSPFMLEYYAGLTREEILKLGHFYELDFKLFGYDFPGPLQDVLDMKATSEQG